METWRDIARYEDHYQVSDLGRVRSLSRRVPLSDGRWRSVKGMILRTENRLTRNGYVTVQLGQLGVKTNFLLHRVVAMAFLEPPRADQTQVNHINGVKTDNRVANLEWVTRDENMAHAVAIGRFEDMRRKTAERLRGTRNPNAKLTMEIARSVRDRYAKGEKQAHIARSLGVTPRVIQLIRENKTWRE